jgi:UDP-N-acetylmuramoyl-tripeptide--D-alanyl-D-alanine ligase
MNFAQIQQITGGNWLIRPVDAVEEIAGGAFDTRSLGEAQIFFAWRGENSDGHRHLHQLKNSDIRLIIVEQDVEPAGTAAILKVPSTLEALHRIASALSRAFGGKIISITGSSGKTTMKTWLCHLLKPHFNLLSNTGTFNNHIGCPLTLLSLKPEHKLLILEMGTSGIGELSLLSSIAPADITVLLNVGRAHLGRFGGIENTYRAKMEIFSHQRSGSLALIPYGDLYLKSHLTTKNIETFGRGAPRFGWGVSAIDPDRRSQTLWLNTPEGMKEFVIGHMGSFAGELISAAAAIIYHLGLSWDDWADRLSDLPGEKGRAAFSRENCGLLILDDTYNANPESLIGMLETLCRLKRLQTIGVIGQLAELEEPLSESAAYILDNLPDGLSHLYLTGATGRILAPMIADRYPSIAVHYELGIIPLISCLKKWVGQAAVIGVKGSRSAHMERVVYALRGMEVGCQLMPCPRLNMCQDCPQLKSSHA